MKALHKRDEDPFIPRKHIVNYSNNLCQVFERSVNLAIGYTTRRGKFLCEMHDIYEVFLYRTEKTNLKTLELLTVLESVLEADFPIAYLLLAS